MISTTPGDTGSRLAEREWDGLSLLPVEDASFRQSIIVRYLGEFHKGISLDQLHRVIHDTKARSPLYLRVVAEELRLHGEHETIDAMIDRFVSADDLLGLFQIMLERLEHDYGAADVRDLLGTIWASRTGLSENELMEITGMSRLQMSRLLFALDYHLLVRNGLLGCFHDYLRRAVENRYLSDPEKRNDRYRVLAEHFADAEPSSRATLELLHALEEMNRKEQVISVLSDIDRLVPVWKSDRFEVLHLWSTTETSVIASACQNGLREWEEGGRSDSERVDAYATVGELYNRVGLLADAKRAQLALIEILRGMGDRAGEASALSVLAEFSRRLGHIEEAGEYASEAEAIGRELNDPALIAGAIGIQGIILSLQSRYDEALQCYVQWERFAREQGDLAGVSRALGGRGAVHSDRGDHDQALACYDECERIARDNGDLQGLSVVIGNRGNVYANRGEYELALACFDQHEDMARRLGNRASMAIAIGNRGSVLRKLGREDEALECYRTWERMARETGDLVSLAGAVGNRGTVHSARGDNDEALACYQEQAELSRRIGNRDSAGIAMGNSAKVYADLNDPVQALKLYHEAASEHRATGYRFGLTYWLNGIADVMLAVVGADGDADPTDMPPCLYDYIPDEDVSDWRKGALRIARDSVEEAISVSRDILKSDTYNAGRILRARISAMEGNVDEGVAELKNLLEDAGNDGLRAAIHFWLWKLGDTDSDHRKDALGLYRSLIHTGERVQCQERIDELERSPDPST